jgi:hypothetical protein
MIGAKLTEILGIVFSNLGCHVAPLTCTVERSLGDRMRKCAERIIFTKARSSESTILPNAAFQMQRSPALFPFE